MWIGLFFSNVRENIESWAELISGNMDSTFQIKFGLAFVILFGLFDLTKIINRKKLFNYSLLSVKEIENLVNGVCLLTEAPAMEKFILLKLIIAGANLECELKIWSTKKIVGD